MNEDLVGWRYRVHLAIHDDQQGTMTHETMGCDDLSELRDFVESIIYAIENREEV